MPPRSTKKYSQLDSNKLELILQDIPENFFQAVNFNPFQYWKEDDTISCKQWSEKIDLAIDEIVQTYYEDFNTSTTSFGSIFITFYKCTKINT